MTVVHMKYADVQRERERMREERYAIFGSDEFNYKPRGLERAYVLPCPRENGTLAAYVYPEGPTITVCFWPRRIGHGMREITDVVKELDVEQLLALVEVKRYVERWVAGEIDSLPPSTHGQ